MLHAAIVRSHAHARIVGIDTSAAAALPGVVAVVTGDDVVKALGPVPEQQVALPNGSQPFPLPSFSVLCTLIHIMNIRSLASS